MIQYRILECLNERQEWQSYGVAYIKDNERRELIFYQLNQHVKLPFNSLNELEGYCPLPDEDPQYRWTEIKVWNKPEEFSPEAILKNANAQPTPQPEQQSPKRPSWQSINDLPRQLRGALIEIRSDISVFEKYPSFLLELKENFIFLHENGLPPYKELVDVLLCYWSFIDRRGEIFPNDVHKVRLLLYAQAFEVPLTLTREQKETLARNKDLYSSLMPPLKAWGVQSALSKNILAMLDSLVIHAWMFQREGIPERIIIVGKGLTEHRENIFNEALVTALRVQASPLDLVNDGLIIINREANVTNTLGLNLAILGANAPLAGAETAAEAMRDLFRRLKILAKNTGFVQVYEADIEDAENLRKCLRKLATKVKQDQEPVLWMPDPENLAPEKELVVSEPILNISNPSHRLIPIQLRISSQLLQSSSWKELIEAYETEVIRRINIDTKIRLESYQKREDFLREEQKQWNQADESERQDRWGTTVKLTERFDEDTGLIIWLCPPEIVSTKEYFQKNVPFLIRYYAIWSERMKDILDSLAKASLRPDAPFKRLAITRFFDAALRRGLNLEIKDMPKVEKLYYKWVTPIINLLNFEWRTHLRSIGVKDKDLFTAHTTFSLFQRIDDSGNITQLLMSPYTLIDVKRSVGLFDTEKQIMIIRDASDYPQEFTCHSTNIELNQQLQQYQDCSNITDFCELLRQMLMQNPEETIKQVFQQIRSQVTKDELLKDLEQLQKLNEQGLCIPWSFSRLIDRADKAMYNSALFTAYASLEKALTAIPQLQTELVNLRDSKQSQHPISIPKKELECRVYLLIAFAGCLTKWSCKLDSKQKFKKTLIQVCHAPHSAGEPEKTALIKARMVNFEYVNNWIEYLAKQGPDLAAKKLTRDLPIEEDFASPKQYAAMRLFDAIEIINIANKLREATKNLSHLQETRATAFIKLGLVLEDAILSYGTGIVYDDLISLLEKLIGTAAPSS